MRRIFLGSFAFLVVYANIANISWCVPGASLPDVPGTKDAFWLFNVFEDYHEYNREIIVEVQVDGRWRRAPESYFPYRRGEVATRLLARRRVGRLSFQNRREAQAFLAKKIRERYAREHPSAPADRVRFVERAWPRRFDRWEPDSEAEVRVEILYTDE